MQFQIHHERRQQPDEDDGENEVLEPAQAGRCGRAEREADQPDAAADQEIKTDTVV